MPTRLEIPDELVDLVAMALRNHADYLSGYMHDSRLKEGLPGLLEQLAPNKKPAKNAGSPAGKRKTG
jgi:hypothetical protein